MQLTLSSYSPSSNEPTSVFFPFLCQRKPATTQSAVRACLTLIIARLPGWYLPSCGFAMTPSRPAPSKRASQSTADCAIARHRREMNRRLDLREQLFEQRAALDLRCVTNVGPFAGQQIERHE